MVVQELIQEHTGQPSLHFALEVRVGNAVYTVDFETGKTAIVYKGSFSPKKSGRPERNLAVTKVSTEKLGMNSTMLGFLGAKNWQEIGKRFKYCNTNTMRAAMLAMRKADSPTLFEKVRKSRPQIRRM
ncbi:MAG: hypothetical protein PHD95_01095 [Candidatus ainarchaeum sp.]|nr:hypothetical protein [Candidatus ainarchaeum sp.]